MNEAYVDDEGTLHEWYTAQIYVHGEHLGEVIYDSGRADLRWHRSSSAFFCRHCGEVWAKLAAIDSRGKLAIYDSWYVACEKHPDPWNIPGSILANSCINLLNLMPDAVIRREFNLLLEQAG